MDVRLSKYADAAKFFLKNVSSISECLEEARKTQEMLSELITLQAELEATYKKAESKFNVFCSDKRDSLFNVLNKNGVKSSSQILEDKLIRLNSKEYEEYKEQLDVAKIDFETAQSLKMAYFQRKDIILEVINYWKSKSEIETCILKNKEFIKAVMRQ